MPNYTEPSIVVLRPTCLFSWLLIMVGGVGGDL